MNNRLQILAKYPPRGASSRLRLHQFIPEFEAHGFVVSFDSLFDDLYLDTIYGKAKPSRQQITQRYLARFSLLMELNPRVPLLIQGELLPWVPAIVERSLLSRRTYALDFDDAIFHRYDMHRLGTVRAFLGKKIDRLIANAKLVIAGNSYLAERAVRAGACSVEIVPTVVDMSCYPLAAFHHRDEPFRVGWIGTPITWRTYGRALIEALCKRFDREPVQFVAIGAEPTAREASNLRFIPWSQQEEGDLLATLSVGLMPLEDTAWARGKCAYKLIQYLACGVPVVASPVGANTDVVQPSVNGFLATTLEEWETSIRILLSDRFRGRAMGLNGRAQVVKRYSTATVGPRLASLVAAMATSGQTRSFHRVAGESC